MKYYAVSDVHGYASYLRKALEDAGFFGEKEPCRLVMCGDLLDRGPEANQLIEFMLQLMKEGRLIYIRGNHEELLDQCLREICQGNLFEIASGMSHHYRNRTWDTLLQIAQMSDIEAYHHPHLLVQRVTNSPFFTKLLPSAIDYYETTHYIFTHGWIPCVKMGIRPYCTYRYDPKWREADALSWHDARWFNGMEIACRNHVIEEGKTIVCGHWHTSYGHSRIHHMGSEWGEDADFSPFSAEGILALDASAPNSMKVNCVVLEDS